MIDSQKGTLERAKRYALKNFDDWNEITGFVSPHTSSYYEILCCIDDAVEYGFGLANGATIEEIEKRIKD